MSVGVTRADGSVVLPAGAVTTNPSTGVYRVGLTAAQNSVLDELTATWTDAGDASTHVTSHEVVGGYYFSPAEARSSDSSLSGASDADLVAARREVEEEFERICGVAFVPRYRRVGLSGDGTAALLLPDPLPRRLRSVRVYAGDTTYTTFTTAEVAAVALESFGEITRTDGVWPAGDNNLIVEYEHGYDAPPPEVKRAALTRLRYLVGARNRSIPDRATSFTAAEGGTYRLDTAGRHKTGIPDVDAVLARWSKSTPALA